MTELQVNIFYDFYRFPNWRERERESKRINTCSYNYIIFKYTFGNYFRMKFKGKKTYLQQEKDRAIS